MPAWRIALALLWLGVAVPSVTRADDAAMARFHHEQASQHYLAGRFDRAVQEFFAAQRLSPNSRTVYNIGLCFLRMRRDLDAFYFLSEYLSLVDDADGADERRRFAQDTLQTLGPSVARVAVRVEPAREGAVIFVDQREHGSYGEAPRVLALPPGPHRVWVELEGYRPAEASVEAVRGQEVEVVLAPERVVGTLAVRGPAGARVRAFDSGGTEVDAGVLPAELRAPPGRVEVEVVAEGYRTYRGFVQVVADERAELLAEPERLPLPTGDVTVTANVAEAVIELDGEPVGLAPLVLTDLSVAARTVRVSAPGHLAWSGELEVEADTRGWLTVQLAPLPTGPSPFTWVVGGAGVASLVAWAITAGLAADRAAEFDARWNHPGGGSVVDLRDEATGLALASDVTLGVALVGLGAAVALYFVTDDSAREGSNASFTRRTR
ncbi:MAG: PEGA domain-containing protein [Sandaracinaceae bacterium]|nr:PEGA domain-containing protein [Sandaracinaceae bacterium]